MDRLLSGWNRMMSVFGGVREEYMRINFGLDPNARWVGLNSNISAHEDLDAGRPYATN
jgi:hypothetical protein